MPSGPGIKGSLFDTVAQDVTRRSPRTSRDGRPGRHDTVAQDVRALVERGALSREALESRLERDDLVLLEEKIGAGFWYPIGSYRRLLETLRDVEGGDAPRSYLRERGAAAARRLIEAGPYRQMDATVETWSERVGRIMVTLAPASSSTARTLSKGRRRERLLRGAPRRLLRRRRRGP